MAVQVDLCQTWCLIQRECVFRGFHTGAKQEERAQKKLGSSICCSKARVLTFKYRILDILIEKNDERIINHYNRCTTTRRKYVLSKML